MAPLAAKHRIVLQHYGQVNLLGGFAVTSCSRFILFFILKSRNMKVTRQYEVTLYKAFLQSHKVGTR